MNYFELHIGDIDSATAHLSMLEDGAYSRLMRLYYRTEKPLSADVRQICRLMRAQTKPERDAVQAVLSEFFELQEDGWHQHRCDEEIARFQDKQRKAKASADARWSRGKPDNGGNANASDDYMRTHGDRISDRDAPRGRAPTRAPARPQSPDTSNHTQTPEQGVRPDATTLRALAEGTAEPEDPAIGAGTRYGLAARAMRQRGCVATPGDPRLRQLVDQGASLEEFEAVGAEAANKGKGPAWALTALINRRKDAAEVRLAPAAAPPPWHETRDGISNRGQALGLGAWQDFERESMAKGISPRYDAYRKRVLEADQAERETTR